MKTFFQQCESQVCTAMSPTCPVDGNGKVCNGNGVSLLSTFLMRYSKWDCPSVRQPITFFCKFVKYNGDVIMYRISNHIALRSCLIRNHFFKKPWAWGEKINKLRNWRLFSWETENRQLFIKLWCDYYLKRQNWVTGASPWNLKILETYRS